MYQPSRIFQQIKYGKVEFVFSTVAGAREAYSTIQKMIIDGIRPEALVDPQFCKFFKN